MQLAISNIAWGSEDLDRHLSLVKQVGFDGVELVPGLLWPDPVKAPVAERRALVGRIADRGLKVVGLHGLLDDRPDLTLFPYSQSSATREYLKRLCSMCSDLGGETLVLGSAKNRARADLPWEDAVQYASELFAEVAAEAAACGVFVLVDPVAATESDFVVSVDQAVELVRATSHPHCKLHLNVGALATSGENVAERLTGLRGILMHVHVGDPGLAPPGSTGLDHTSIGEALRTAGYDRFLSVTMRPAGPLTDVITQSFEYVRRHYLAQDVV